MDIDELKTDFKKIRVPKMDVLYDEVSGMEDFVQRIRKQDRDDEGYILKMKLLPLAIGIFMFAILMLMAPDYNIIFYAGCLLVFSGLIVAGVLYLLEYHNISAETFGISVTEFLEKKEKRLKSWRFTPHGHNIVFAFYIVGLLMMITGNTSLVRDLGTVEYLVLYILANLALLTLAGFIGEYFYRKRHREQHQPLLEMIQQLKNELENG